MVLICLAFLGNQRYLCRSLFDARKQLLFQGNRRQPENPWLAGGYCSRLWGSRSLEKTLAPEGNHDSNPVAIDSTEIFLQTPTESAISQVNHPRVLHGSEKPGGSAHDPPRRHKESPPVPSLAFGIETNLWEKPVTGTT